MTAPTQDLRRRISLALIGLGLALPALYLLYLSLRFQTEPASFGGLLFLYAFQWLPFTTLSWTLAAWLWPDERGRFVWWLVLILGASLSLMSYILHLALG